MPYDPKTTEVLDIVPALSLMARGSWQLELAHARDSHLVLWITRGQGRALLNGAQKGFGPHTVLHIPARHLFALELGRQCIGQVLCVPETVPCALPETPCVLRISDMQEQGQMNALFEAALRELQRGDDHSDQGLRSYADLIGITLRRQLERAPQPSLNASKRLSRAFCQRLASVEACQQNMGDHAIALDVTPTHLTRVCKAETGKTAATLLTERQLHAARTSLSASTRPMRQIAQDLGFGSPAYFTRFISQHTGATPSQLRKSAQTARS